MKVVAGLLVVFLCADVLASTPSPRTLTFEDRVNAQEAIERVYYSHQIGVTKPYETAIPRAFLEDKVRKYLEQSVALSVYWKTAVTDEMLQRELERMARGTRMPERLLELYSALGDDSFLIKECLARPALVDRLAHNFFAFDPNVHGEARRQAEELRRQLSTGELSPSTERLDRRVFELVVGEMEAGPSSPPKPRQQSVTLEQFRMRRAELPARAGDVSDVEESPDAFVFSVILSETAAHVRVAKYVVAKTPWDVWWDQARRAVQADSVAAVAASGGSVPAPRRSIGTQMEPLNSKGVPCSVDDTWDNGTLGGAPNRREDHTAVWTGTLMIVWGGSGADYGVLASGGRYDPATDSWTATSVLGAPSARTYHTAVWTGSQMVVWGGYDHGYLASNTGGRYDPVTDRWSGTSLENAPTGRFFHTAVWTGSLMLVWGGSEQFDLFTPLDTGGRYDPMTDVWTSTSTTGAPVARETHSAVWTGTQMVVWGGYWNDGSSVVPCDTGGRYDPATDSWTPTSTTDSPTECIYKTAVWTGSQMLVWCTHYQFGETTNSGARYDPFADTWTTMSSFGGHRSGGGYSAVWTGGSMVIWGGSNSRHFFDDEPRGIGGGAQYDPATDTWKPTPTGAPPGSFRHTAVWTGSLMVVWGGDGGRHDGGVRNTGGRYDPATDTWTPTSTIDGPSARSGPTSVWTGNLMVVWGGDDGGFALTSGGRYDPATDTWTPTSTTGAPSARWLYSSVWTGNLMVVWGGDAGYQNYLDTGGRYDPSTDTWTPTSMAGAPTARGEHTAVWTGIQMIVWGGFSPALPANIGGRYDPETNTWAPMAATDSPSARWGHTAVWTGSVMVVWGGGTGNYPDHVNTGGRYDPAADRWTPTTTVGAPSARGSHTAVWTGSVMVIWGGEDAGDLGTGGRYDATTDTWTPTTLTGAPDMRMRHTAVWTGSLMVVWGGFSSDGALNTGGRYDPATDRWTPTTRTAAPTPRYSHTTVWTGSLMVVWGGWGESLLLDDGGRYVVAPVDGDGDGYSTCEGDCNDVNPTVHPGATESCNGIDDDCDGLVDNGAAELCDDGNACTSGDTCSGGVCVSGTPLLCIASDPCHAGGICDPATGVCSSPSKPDGTSCDDGDLCTAGDMCQTGVCTPAFSGLNQPKPKSSGYYKKLCEKREHDQLPYQGDQLTDADAACVGDLTLTFAGIATVDDVCNVLDKDQHGGRHHGGPGDGPDGKDCDKGEDELIATALNVCRARVCEEQNLDSRCHGNAHTTVSQSFADADAILDDAARTKDTCKDARCELREINNGHALEMNSLALSQATGAIRLSWFPMELEDGTGTPDKYEVWRRPMSSSAAFSKLGTTTGLTFLDGTAGTAMWEYEVTADIP